MHLILPFPYFSSFSQNIFPFSTHHILTSLHLLLFCGKYIIEDEKCQTKVLVFIRFWNREKSPYILKRYRQYFAYISFLLCNINIGIHVFIVFQNFKMQMSFICDFKNSCVSNSSNGLSTLYFFSFCYKLSC